MPVLGGRAAVGGYHLSTWGWGRSVGLCTPGLRRASVPRVPPSLHPGLYYHHPSRGSGTPLEPAVAGGRSKAPGGGSAEPGERRLGETVSPLFLPPESVCPRSAVRPVRPPWRGPM